MCTFKGKTYLLLILPDECKNKYNISKQPKKILFQLVYTSNTHIAKKTFKLVVCQHYTEVLKLQVNKTLNHTGVTVRNKLLCSLCLRILQNSGQDLRTKMLGLFFTSPLYHTHNPSRFHNHNNVMWRAWITTILIMQSPIFFFIPS